MRIQLVLNGAGKVLTVIIGLVCLYGIWHIVTGLFPMAEKRSRRSVKSYLKSGTKRKKSNVNSMDDAMQQLSKKIVPYIHMNAIERSEKEKTLALAKLAYTPEEYKAYMLTVSGVFAVFGVIMYIIGAIAGLLIFKIIGVGIVLIGIGAYIVNDRKLIKNRKNTLAEVESELPRFVSYIVMTLENNDESILSMIERYTPAQESFTDELAQTVADAKTSTFESAMARWDQRINSDKLRQVINGLINANDGSDVTTYFAMLNRELTSYEIVLLKGNIETIPSRMRVPKALMYVSLAITLFFPLIMQIIDSFRDAFMT